MILNASLAANSTLQRRVMASYLSSEKRLTVALVPFFALKFEKGQEMMKDYTVPIVVQSESADRANTFCKKKL
jgi:hypothetical protein